MSTKITKNDVKGSLEGAVIFWMHRVDRQCRSEVLSRFRSRGYPLSAIQWEVLSMLWQRDGVIQSLLAEARFTSLPPMPIVTAAASRVFQRDRPRSPAGPTTPSPNFLQCATRWNWSTAEPPTPPSSPTPSPPNANAGGNAWSA